MEIVFLICATLGGTILVIQFGLALIGLSGHGFDSDVSHDVGSGFGGDVGHDFSGDVHAAGGDLHGDATVDAHDGHAAAAGHHGSTWLFGVISFRTVVAAVTFFGIAGLIADSAEAALHIELGVALAAGLAAMFGVYFLMRALYSLKTEGTVRIWGAVGKTATVYVPIPAQKSGAGKIQINLQNRTMEYLAMTSGDKLPTGAKVVVTDVITSDTLEVQSVSDSERNEDVQSSCRG